VNIKSLLTKNSFPAEFVDKLVSIFLNRMHSKNKNANDNTDKEKPTICVLPFLGTYTKRLERRIKQTIRQHMPSLHIRFIYRSSARLSSLFTFKDKIPQYLASGIVYKYTCSGCNSTYIGETTRHAKKRFSEHMGISALTGKIMATPMRTAVSDHNIICRAKMQWKDFTIIGRENESELNLRIKESLFCRRDRPRLNIQGSSIPLELF
jgi:hypothetical protein